jgi:hypothetical protein
MSLFQIFLSLIFQFHFLINLKTTSLPDHNNDSENDYHYYINVFVYVKFFQSFYLFI